MQYMLLFHLVLNTMLHYIMHIYIHAIKYNFTLCNRPIIKRLYKIETTRFDVILRHFQHSKRA